MKKTVLGFLIAMFPVVALASGAGVHLDKANINPDDRNSLQRGAKYFVNYCLSCHSASYMRFNRMGKDLGINDTQLLKNMMFKAEKVGETMDVNMKKSDAKNWFGTPAPDLSVIARSRSVDWIYTYLRSFYVDEKRPFGVNNTVFPDVAMPHVLWELQGMQKANFKTETDKDGNVHQVLEGYDIVKQGSMTPKEYDQAVRDLVNFLDYLGEPGKKKRLTVGIYVLLFLVVFFFVSYRLKKEYWKDVH
jgi:ubiquinol-cytochrome c reductase cytochrome c1 subunit